MTKKETILTKRQIEILKLRKKGYSQTEVAKKLGTSRANISSTEKSALENIRRAERTIEMVKALDAPIWLNIKTDRDLNEVVREIYDKADKEGVWIPHSFPSLVNLIQGHAEDGIKGRRVLKEFEIAITKDGEIIVR